MITQSESGLTLTDYNAIKAAIEGGDWKVVFHRLNLDFANQLVSPLESEASKDFDAVVVGDHLYVYVAGDVRIWLLTDWTLLANHAIPNAYDTTIAPSIVAGSGEAHLFVVGSGGTTIQRYDVTTSAITLTHTINTGGPVTAVAASSADRVHYAVKDTSKKIYNLRAAEYDSDWTLIASDVWWMYPIQSMDVVTITQQSKPTDVIGMITQVPGVVATSTEGDKVFKTLEPSAGVISFKYRDNKWSDHIEIETVENVGNHRLRRDIRMEIIHGQIVATAFGVSGSKAHSFPLHRVYTGKDGRYWSLGRGFPLGEDSDRGIKLVAYGDYLIAVQAHRIDRTPCTLEFGYSPASMQVEAPGKDIVEMSARRDPAFRLQMTVANENRKYDESNVLALDARVAAVLYCGFNLPGDTVPTLVQVGVFEADYYDDQVDTPGDHINLSLRDYFSRLTDRSQSEESYYADNQLIGGDTYTNSTQSAYGGLRHTATQVGTWQTPDNILELRSSNTEGLSFATHTPYLWNGGYQAKFKLSTPNNIEFAGIVFRALDKDNHWFARYEYAVDRVRLYMRLRGTDTLIAQTGVMGWRSSITWRWMRVDFRYARIRVYTSTDGISWTLAINHLCNGQHEPGTVGPVVLDKGFTGQIGKGYSPSDNWEFPTWTIPDLTFIPPDFDLDFDFNFLPGFVGGIGNVAILGNPDGTSLITQSLTADTPYWGQFGGYDGLLLNGCFDRATEYAQTDGESGALGMYAVTADGDNLLIQYCDNVLDPDPSFSTIYTEALDHPPMSARILQSQTNHDVLWVAYETAYGRGLIGTIDGGTGWDATTPPAVHGDGYDPVIPPVLAICDQTGDALTVYRPIFGGGFKPLYAENSGSAITENDGFGSPTSIVSTDDQMELASADQKNLYLATKDQLGGAGIDTDLQMLATDSTTSEWSLTVTSQIDGDTPHASPERITSACGLKINGDLNQTGLTLQHEFTMLYPAMIDAELDLDAEHGYTVFFSGSSSIQGTMVFTYQVEDAYGLVYTRVVQTDLATSATTLLGEKAPAGTRVYKITTTLTVSGYSQHADVVDTQFKVNDFHIDYQQEPKLQYIQNYDALSPTRFDRTPLVNGILHGRVKSISSHESSHGTVAALVMPSDDQVAGQAIVRSANYGQSWQVLVIPEEADSIYLAPDRNVFALGYRLVFLAHPGRQSKAGNIDSIWGDEWYANWMISI